MKQKIIKILKFHGMPDLFYEDAANEIMALYKKKPKPNQKFNKAAFKLVLLDLGAEEQHIDDWFAVRDKKKAVYTSTALTGFINECNNNNFPVNEAVRICAEKNWQGFKYSWLENVSNNAKQQQSQYQASDNIKQRIANKISQG